MRAVEIIRRPRDAERSKLIAFVDRMTLARGARPLSDHLWLDLNSADDDGFTAVTVEDETGVIAMAQISAGNDSFSLEALVDDVQDARRVLDDAVETAVDTFRRNGGGRLWWWVDNAGPEDHAFAGAIGLSPQRELYEMRRSLPLDRSASITTRSFVPGQDDEAWIAVNNGAFAEHAEQGGWTVDTLASRVAEPWFDSDGFRLHESDGQLAAFCWTKLHTDHDPVLGEIYVIAVDPAFHGQGLGTELTLAGLDSIAGRGVTTAMLYVDAHNTPAVALYRRLGFTIYRTRHAFSADLSDAQSTDSPIPQGA